MIDGNAARKLQPYYCNLNGTYGYGSDVFGMAAGSPTGDHFTADPTNGIRFLDGSDNVAAQMSSNIFKIGDATNYVSYNADTAAFDMAVDTFSLDAATGGGDGSFTTSGILLHSDGYLSAPNFYLDSSGGGALNDLDLSGVLTMGAGGEITNSGGDYSITDSGIFIERGTASENKITFGTGGVEDHSIYAQLDGAVKRLNFDVNTVAFNSVATGNFQATGFNAINLSVTGTTDQSINMDQSGTSMYSQVKNYRQYLTSSGVLKLQDTNGPTDYFTVDEDGIDANNYKSGKDTISDDNVATIANIGSSGRAMLFVNFDFGGTPRPVLYSLKASFDVSEMFDVSGLARPDDESLSGTTGADGRLNITCTNSGDVQLENRLGSQITFYWTLNISN